MRYSHDFWPGLYTTPSSKDVVDMYYRLTDLCLSVHAISSIHLFCISASPILTTLDHWYAGLQSVWLCSVFGTFRNWNLKDFDFLFDIAFLLYLVDLVFHFRFELMLSALKIGLFIGWLKLLPRVKRLIILRHSKFDRIVIHVLQKRECIEIKIYSYLRRKNCNKIKTLLRQELSLT